MRVYLTAILMVLIAFVSFGQNNVDAFFPQGPTVYTQVMEDLENDLITEEEAILYILQSVKAHERLPKRYIDLPMERSQSVPMKEVYRMLANREPEEGSEILELLERPSLPNVHSTEHFDIHYGSGVSYTNVATYMEDGYDYIHDVLDYFTPPSDGGVGGSSRYDIYISSTSSGVLGYAAPEATGPEPWPDATSYIVISSDIVYDTDYTKVTTIHEYFHAVQFGYDAMDPENFYFEHSSCWVEKERWPDFSMHASQMPSFFNYPEVSLREYNGEHEYGSYHFNEYVDQTFGRDAIKEIWEATRYSSMLNSWQSVFMDYGSSRTDALAEFWEWCYFTGTRATPHGSFIEAGDYPTIAIETDHATYPASGSVTGLDNYGVGYVRFYVPGGASGPFNLIFDGDADALWNAQLLLIDGASYEVREITLNSYGYGVLELDSTEYEGLDEMVLIGGVVSQSGSGWGFTYTGQFDDVDPTFNPPRNLVAESDNDGFVPLDWDNPLGASIGGYDVIAYDDGMGGGTLPMADYGIDFEGVSFDLASACTLKQIILMGAPSASGNVTIHVYADDGSGYADMGTEFGSSFSASISAGTWDTTAVPGGGIYLDAGTYFIGYDRVTEDNAVLLDAETTENRSAAHTSEGSWAALDYDYLFRIGIKSIGSTGGLTGFNVYRGSSSGGPYSYLTTTATSEYTDSAVVNGTAYYYAVKADYAGEESPYSNEAMAVPNESSTGEGLLGDCELSPEGYYRFGSGNAAAQEFNIDRPVQITQVLYATHGEGYFQPKIHPYASDRVQPNILPATTWYCDSTEWQVIDITDYNVIVNNDFLVSYQWMDTSVYLGYENVEESNCWTNFGVWTSVDTLQFSIMCVVRELDTTVTYTLEGTVNLDLGSGGSSGADDLSGSIVSILGTDKADTTGTDGYYRIDSIPPGFARVKAWHSGYESQMIDIGFESDVRQNFALLPIGIPKNPPQDLFAGSYLDSEVPLYWSVPVGAPGTQEELFYFDEEATWYYGGVDEGDIQFQQFTTHFPCSLQSTYILFYDSVGVYSPVDITVFADDGWGYPDISSPLTDTIRITPVGYPDIDYVDLSGLEVEFEAGQSFHIGVINTANHSFVVADSNASTTPSRSKIYWSTTTAWSDSVQDFIWSTVVKYNGFSSISEDWVDAEPIAGPIRDGYMPERSSVGGPVRRYFGVLGSSDITEAEEFEVMQGYNIYRAEEEDGEYELIYTAESDTFHYTDDDVDNGTRYWYKLTTMYFHGESDSAGPATAIPLEWRDSADVLIVDDDGSSYIRGAEDVFDPYAQALDAIGLTYNVVEPCCSIGTPGPSAEFMADYDAVLWFTGEGWHDSWSLSDSVEHPVWTLSEDDEAELAAYLDDGGAVALFGSDYLKDRYDGVVEFEEGTFAYDRLGIERIIPDNWHIKEGGTAFVANGYDDGFAEGQSWEATAEYYAPDSILVDYFYTHTMQNILGIEIVGRLQPCAIANYDDDKIFFSSLPLEALTNHAPPNTRADFMNRLFNDYLWATLGDTAVTYNMPIYRGWNMVSMPVTLDDYDVNVLFPGFVGTVYTFNPESGIYDAVDSIEIGKGYFVLMPNDTTLSFTGMPVRNYTSSLYRGWNMLGSVYEPENVSIPDEIRLGPGVSIIGDTYNFDTVEGIYSATSDITRGLATWMLLDDNTFITVPDTTGLFKATEDMPEVDIEMQIGGHSFNFGITKGQEIVDCIPPNAPGDDANNVAFIHYKGFRAHTLYNANGNFEITVNNSNMAKFDIPDGYAIEVDGKMLMEQSQIALSKGKHDIRIQSIPDMFAITGISPNPFNPETSIEFMIPERADIDISIYDIDGRMVERLANATYNAGRHSIVWNASENTTGIYFVMIQANGDIITDRLLLVK
ncbi:MAG: T9SS type A sorting domain-containing protein [Candidatus Zixiibacteriota bacterium]